MENMDKVFFMAGDVVTIKHDLSNKPKMLVKNKESRLVRDGEKDHFIGIKCFWFTTEGLYQEQVFNTKDLIHV